MKQKRSDQLREGHRRKIAMGDYPPGKRLDEAELLTEFRRFANSVARGPDPTCFSGLIELRPRRGAVVAQLGPRQLIEMFEVMGELEAMCGRLAARRITVAEQKELIAAPPSLQGSRGIRRPGRLLLCEREVSLRDLCGEP
jgi:DNA-binding FadR family transcriptional regulator